MASFSAEDQAIRMVCARDFHQSLWLPETAEHSKLRVTFATTTNFDDVSLPAILFIGPMFSTRWNALHFDSLARKCDVRVICVDRPGFGGSTPVTIDIRMRVWLETVPAVLQRLDVTHVAIVTHSAGALYTLNTLLHHRSLLDPKAPYVSFLAPWVPNVHSGAFLPTLAAKMPSSLLDSYADLITFIDSKIIPSASWSGEFISSTAALLSISASAGISRAETSTSTAPFERQGFAKITAKFIDKLSLKYRFAESTTGANEEVKLCLRKCDDADLAEAADYSQCICKIAANEAALFYSREPNSAKLCVEAVFSGMDNMVSKRGREYFQRCWESVRIEGKFDLFCRMNPKADHNSVLDNGEKGGIQNVFIDIAKLSRKES